MRLRWKLAQAAEIRWWRRYWNKKDTTAYLQWKRGYWNQFLQQCGLDIPAHSRCLDAGCGPAGVFIALQHCLVDAVDPLLEQYQQSLRQFDTQQYPYVQFHNSTLEQWATPNGQPLYQYVFCLNVINHVSDWEQSLQNVWNAVATGGTMVLSVDVNRFRWAGWLFRNTWGDVLHPHQHQRQDYEKVFAQLPNAHIEQTILLKKGFWFDYYAWVLRKMDN